jgi:hypothetical protein
MIQKLPKVNKFVQSGHPARHFCALLIDSSSIKLPIKSRLHNVVEGDRMSFRKKHIFCRNHWVTFTLEESGPKNWAISLIKKLPKVNSHPIGKNSPNLVTLMPFYYDTKMFFHILK